MNNNYPTLYRSSFKPIRFISPYLTSNNSNLNSINIWFNDDLSSLLESSGNIWLKKFPHYIQKELQNFSWMYALYEKGGSSNIKLAQRLLDDWVGYSYQQKKVKNSYLEKYRPKMLLAILSLYEVFFTNYSSGKLSDFIASNISQLKRQYKNKEYVTDLFRIETLSAMILYYLMIGNSGNIYSNIKKIDLEIKTQFDSDYIHISYVPYKHFEAINLLDYLHRQLKKFQIKNISKIYDFHINSLKVGREIFTYKDDKLAVFFTGIRHNLFIQQKTKIKKNSKKKYKIINKKGYLKLIHSKYNFIFDKAVGQNMKSPAFGFNLSLDNKLFIASSSGEEFYHSSINYYKSYLDDRGLCDVNLTESQIQYKIKSRQKNNILDFTRTIALDKTKFLISAKDLAYNIKDNSVIAFWLHPNCKIIPLIDRKKLFILRDKLVIKLSANHNINISKEIYRANIIPIETNVLSIKIAANKPVLWSISQ